MKTTERKPLLTKFTWAGWAMAVTYLAYGVIAFTGQRILSQQVMKSSIDVSTYQSRIAAFNLFLGIVISLALGLFYVLSIAGSRGKIRAAFVVGIFSALGPVFSALSTTILFKVLKLPSMGAGSVIASAAAALLLVLPCLVMFIILAGCRTLKPSSRLLGVLIGITALIVAVFPSAVTVLALVVMPGNPAMPPLMNLSSYLIHVKSVVLGAGVAVLYFLNRVSH